MDEVLRDETIVPLNRRRLAFASAVLLAFSVLFALAFAHGDGAEQILLGGLTLLLGLLAVHGLWKTIDPRPALLLTSKGFLDRTSPFSSGFVEWKDVREIVASVASIRSFGAHGFLTVILSNPDKYISRHGPLTRWQVRSALSRFGSPVIIHARSLSLPAAELVRLFTEYRKRAPRA
jgi:hypothetical protein